jgi:hypothetical protein
MCDHNLRLMPVKPEPSGSDAMLGPRRADSFVERVCLRTCLVTRLRIIIVENVSREVLELQNFPNLKLQTSNFKRALPGKAAASVTCACVLITFSNGARLMPSDVLVCQRCARCRKRVTETACRPQGDECGLSSQMRGAIAHSVPRRDEDSRHPTGNGPRLGIGLGSSSPRRRGRAHRRADARTRARCCPHILNLDPPGKSARLGSSGATPRSSRPVTRASAATPQSRTLSHPNHSARQKARVGKIAI